MIIISEDNIKIYDLLEKTGQLFTDFSVSKVTAFDHDDDFHVIIYISISRNFILFSAANTVKNTNVFPDLINVIQEYSDAGVDPSLF